MPYHSETKRYKCKLNLEDEQDKQILDMLIKVLGKPRQTGRLHPFTIIEDDKTYQGFQISVEENLLTSLKKHSEELGVNFSQFFEPDYGHFHPYCIINGEYHEGIAEGDENGWKLYYTDEHGLERFVCYIRNEDIDELDEINSILNDWLIKNFLR